MNLGKQIDSLLKKHPSVYVKGLGVFNRIHTPATFDSKRNVFLPPISYVEFDHFSVEGYDFLVYLQQVEQLDRQHAESKLEGIVSNLIDDLSQNGEIVLDNLGSFVSYGNSFVFKPVDLTGFLYTPIEDDYYQVEVTSTTPAESKVPENEKAPLDSVEDKVSPVESVESKQEEEIPTVVPTHVSTEEEPTASTSVDVDYEQPKESSSYIYGIVAALALIILAGIYFYTKNQAPKELIEKNIMIEVPVLDTTALSSDTLEVVRDSSLIDSTTIAVKDTVAKIAKKEIVTNYKYTIVIGTHKTLEQATDEAKAYNKEGHKSVRVLEPNMSKNLKRVIWDTYPTREKRDSALREVRKRYKEDAWGSEI